MALDARHARVRGILVAHVLGLHDRVTCRAAKFPRIHDGHTVISSSRQNARIQKRRKCERPSEPGEPRAVPGNVCEHLQIAAKAASGEGNAERHENQTQYKERWNDEEDDDAEIGIVKALEDE